MASSITTVWRQSYTFQSVAVLLFRIKMNSPYINKLMFGGQLILCAQLLTSSMYLAALSANHHTFLHFPWPLYWVRALMSSFTSPPLPSSTLPTCVSMARTSVRVSSVLLRAQIINSSHLTLSRILIMSQLLTLMIETCFVTQEASEDRCSAGIEARSTSCRTIRPREHIIL